MKLHLLPGSIILTLVLSLAPSSHAALSLYQLEHDPATCKVEGRPENYFDKFQKERCDFEKKYGTYFALLINYVQQVVLSNNKYEGNSLGAWYYNALIGQRFWQGSLFVTGVEGGAGKALNNKTPTFSGLADIAPEGSTCYVPVLYIKQELFDGKVYLCGGRMDQTNWFDVNALANSGDTQFLSSALVNNPTIQFPDYENGFVAGIKPVDWFYAQAGMADAPAFAGRVGLRDAFYNKLILAETGLCPKIGNHQGHYRFIIRHNKRTLGLTGGSGTQDGDTGFALCFDQELTDRTGVFFRYGLADQRVCKVSDFWSCGFQIKRPFLSRKNDLLGIGMAQSITGNDFRKANGPGVAAQETIFEAYYNFQLNQIVTLTPDLQVVINPDANNNSDPMVVASVRALLFF